MSDVLWVVVLVLAFAACRWSGGILDRHYADRAELSAVVLVGISVLLPLGLGADEATLGGLPMKVPLAIAVIGGLLRRKRVA